ncbi:MAG: DUF2283 domain-containing protein [Spirochaetes bacterium]|nr:DUF2283 domain-containing protein [Spirochaetota bacterium]
MKIQYDKKVDTAYIKLSNLKPTGVVEIIEGFNIDTTDEGKIVGIEILNASKKFPIENLFKYEIDNEIYSLKK